MNLTPKAMIQKILNFFFGKRINGKEEINRQMSEKYDDDWLEQLDEKMI